MWTHVAVYAVAALVAAAYGRRERAGWFVAGFLLYMAVEDPVRAQVLPGLVDRFVVVGWDAVFLLAIAGVLGRWLIAAAAGLLWVVVAAGSMLVPDPVAWLTAWHVASVVAALVLLMRYGGAADATSVGVLAVFVAVDFFMLAAVVGVEWGVLRLSSSLSPAVAVMLYAWRMIPVRDG